MKLLDKQCREQKTFPDESFISCLCCIPRAWSLFVNDQWMRVFESRAEGLELIKEFRNGKFIGFSEPISFMEKVLLWLDEAVWNNEFDHLIVVAPALTLNQINKALSPAVLARTIAEVDWPATAKSAREAKKRQKPFHPVCDKNQ